MFECRNCEGTGRLLLAGVDRLEALAEEGFEADNWEPSAPCGRCGGTGRLTVEDLNWELDTGR